MIRATISSLLSPAELSHRILLVYSSPVFLTQYRGRRRTTTPPRWVPPVYEKNREHMLDEENRNLLKQVMEAERKASVQTTVNCLSEIQASMAEINPCTRRTGILARKIGMLPQWTITGERILCTLLEVAENHVVSVTSPDEWYRKSIVGKHKAFNRAGPMWKVTIGAIDGDVYKFTHAYRNQFACAGVPVKNHLGSFLVSEDALPSVGIPLDVRHFTVGQFVTATGKTIDWGFQGGMHRWGMRGQPARRTTKSHRRIGSVGSTGDARIWPGKRMPGHMGYEWATISGLQIVRMNIDEQVIYIKGNVPGEIGDIIQLKDCLQPEKKIKVAPLPTWSPNLGTIEEQLEDIDSTVPKELLPNEVFSPMLFRFASPSIVFTDADAKKSAGRDRTKAKIAKVKK